MKNLWKRSISLVLAIVMVIGMVPTSVFAADENSSLWDADGVLWLYDENGGISKEFEKIVFDEATFNFGLDDLIRNAVGETNSRLKVTYDGVNVGSYAVYSLLESQGGTETQFVTDVKTALKERKLVKFEVGGESKYLAVRRIQDVVIGEKIVISLDVDDRANTEAEIHKILDNPLDYVTITNKGDRVKNDKARAEIISVQEMDEYYWPGLVKAM